MRVLHVVTAFPRHAADPITPWLVELIRRQRAAGFDAAVFAPAYRGGPNPADGGTGLPVERFRYAPAPLETLTHDETVPDRLRRAPHQALLVPAYLAGGVRAAQRRGRGPGAPDVVHVHWPMPHAVFGGAFRAASDGRCAVVCSYYSVEINWTRARLPLLVPFLRWTVRMADEVTAISSPTASAVRRLVERPVAVIPYGAALADDGAPPARPALAREPGEPVRILFVGRLVERKGVEVLVRAVASLAGRAAAVPPLELRIVGEGEWAPAIRAAARETGLRVENGAVSGGDTGRVTEASSSGVEEEAAGWPGAPAARVRLLGRLSDADLRREYESADLFVLPAVRDAKGDTEGLGVVLLEALRFERPVIGSDIGGIPDIVRHGETGLLTPPGDAAALADAIDRLISDPDAARELARRGRAEAAARFGWSGVVDATGAAYDRARRARTADG